jgi:type III pantothenate kinase
MPDLPFLAADIGNARIKLGLFAGGCAAGLPEPLQTLPLLGDEPELDQIEPWLANIPQHGGADIPVCPEGCGLQGRQECLPHLTYHWWLASVNRPAATRLIDWLTVHRPEDRITLLASGDLPLEVRLDRPDMVGIDRLVDALAINRLRDPARPAVIVDVGTAITVDLVSADGAFLGGAILPGIQMAAKALHHFTDMLPLVSVPKLTAPPPALGTATVPAIQSGLFWGTVGAIRQLIEELTVAASRTGCPTCPTQPDRLATCPTAADVFLTGGAGAAVAGLLGPDARYVPNLTLSGIALAVKVEWQ